MEEKARLYTAMKRGEYIGRSDYDERGLVDFDRKWAESQERGDRSDDEPGSSSDGSDTDDEEIEYLDEFGRLRMGTKSQQEKEERQQRIRSQAAREQEEMSARPSAPSGIIYGDTVQHQAFNPDQKIEEQMAAIAAKRDKSATPPPDTHYDANWEIRNRGTGFYQFSGDNEERKREQQELENQRTETEKKRQEKEDSKERRKQELEQRKNLIAAEKRKREADNFLESLDVG